MRFELYLSKQLNKMNKLARSFYKDRGAGDIRRYLYEPMEHYSENAGKRHRPLICLIACEAVGGNPKRAESSAAAIEHFHTAALIHDDIQDEALTRRGEPCYHIVEGMPLAINAGDLALSQVTGAVVYDSLLDPDTKIRVLKELVDMTTRTIEGQALDIGWVRDKRFDLSTEDYLKMARLKTAYYSGAVPLAVGALVGGADNETIEALRSFGMATGLAFQIQDDIINLVGSDRSKDFRGDITEGKRTLIALHALSHSTPENHARLLELLQAHTTEAAKLDEAVELMQASGSIDFASNYALKLVDKAKQELERALPPSKAKDLLLSMADFFVSRAH